MLFSRDNKSTVCVCVCVCVCVHARTSVFYINHLNAKLNPIYPMLSLFGAHHILHVSR